MKRGIFITVEGVEGVGKTTNIDHIRQVISDAGHEVIVTREPGGTALAEQIRQLVLNPESKIPDVTELLLVFAARHAHVTEKIRPAIEQGTWVICDRFTDATIAYQGAGRGIDTDLIYTLAAVVHGDLWPNLTLLLDMPVADGLARAASRSTPDRFEREELAFFERVRQGYLDLARTHPNRIKIINAAQPLPIVRQKLNSVLLEILTSGLQEGVETS